MSFTALIVQWAKLSKLCFFGSVCMKQPFHAKDRVAAYFRKGVGAAAKGTGQWDSVLWPNPRCQWNDIEWETKNSWATLKRDPWWQGQTLLNRECEYLHGMIDALGTHVYRFNSLIGRYALRTGGLMRVSRGTRGMRRNLDCSVLNDWLNWLVEMTSSIGYWDLWIAQACNGDTKEIWKDQACCFA